MLKSKCVLNEQDKGLDEMTNVSHSQRRVTFEI